MPIPLIPAIGAGLSLFDSVFNAASTSANNSASLDWSKEQWRLNRSAALQDWDMQNKYNHPSQQMQRYKEAGLNPHLIYGQSNTAAPVRSTEAAKWSPQAPQTTMGEIHPTLVGLLGDMLGQKKTEVQTDNLEAQRKLIEQQIRLTSWNSTHKAFDYKLKSEMAPYQLGYADIRNTNLLKQNRQADANYDYTVQENARKAARLNMDLKTAIIQNLKTKAEISKIGVEKALINQTIKNLQTGRLGMVQENTIKELQAEWDGLRNNRGYFDPADQEQIKAMSHVLQAATLGIISRK